MNKKTSGQITIFSAIILLAIFTLAGLLVDLSRISAGRAMVKRAVESAARSLLADYSSKLKEGYGLFALSGISNEDLSDNFEENLNCNLSIPYDEAFYKGSADLFGFRIEKINVTPIYNLSENKVTKQQILEYMKYRAPAELVEGFINRLKAVKEVGRMSAVLKQKVGIDKILGSMDKSQQRLKKSVDGTGNPADKFINGFNLDGIWEKTFSEYNSVAESSISIKSNLDNLEILISQFEEQKKQGNRDRNTGGTVSIESVEEIQNSIETLKAEKSELQKKYTETQNQLQLIWDKIRNSLTGDYIKVNEDAIGDIKRITEKGKNAREAIASLEAYLDENFKNDGNSGGDESNKNDGNTGGEENNKNNGNSGEGENNRNEGNSGETESYEDSGNFGSTGNDFSTGFKEETKNELGKLKELILNGNKAEEILQNVSGNSALLKSIISSLDEPGIGPGYCNNAPSGLPTKLLDMVESYVNINYKYAKPEKGNKQNDPREGKAEAIKEFIEEKILKDINFLTEGIDENSLPSRTKIATENYDEEDQVFIDEKDATIIDGEDEAVTDEKKQPFQDIEYEAPIGSNGAENVKDDEKDNEKDNEKNSEKEDEKSNTVTTEAGYKGNLGDIGNEADLFNEEGMFQENALGFISDIGSIIGDGALALRDNIYINEYIMGTFKNSVTEIKKGNESIKDSNLQSIEKTSLQTFYDSEVEYILHGNPSQKLNNVMTKGEILLIRFGLDTLHVYTDSKKKTMATGIATAVAGWWTGGAGIPIISNLIMAGWGMGEAILDMSDLMEGKSVPIYKMPGDWKLDIGLPAAKGARTDPRLYFNYHDYLRLFLLTMDENKKLDRIEDLIQLNTDKLKSEFRMSRCNTFVRVEAEVSMKYLFITRPFMQKTLKTKDGRYVFKVVMYEGY